MNDPTISAAFSIASKKGAYALLLGSGVSRSAEIPTGWEIVRDLIIRIANVAGKDCGSDPIGWYQNEYGKEADYSDLLASLAKSPEDRNAILRRYFEPTEEERARGAKMPKPAHKAIAALVSGGYVRVIVTTNFDRLVEHALQERGITPMVISTTDQAQGALPLVHTNCTIIKVNGDYLDTRIKNTSAELGSYDERISNLLDRVFDEYGLVVCGWSATWDAALCRAMERCQSHRFTTFWCKRGGLEEAANRVINSRRADVIEIKDADSFFLDVEAKVAAIEEFDKPHPLSSRLASAMVKRYLVNERDRILLHDLVAEETERVCGQLTDKHFPTMAQPTDQSFVNRIHRYEALTEVLLAIVATGCFWGQENQALLWASSLERVADSVNLQTGITLWANLRLYPALLLLYGGGLSAVASGNYCTLATYLAKPRYKGPEGGSTLIHRLHWLAPIQGSPEAANLLFPKGAIPHRWPMNEYLHNYLRPALREFVPSDSDYDNLFDRFEYLFATVWADEERQTFLGWAPLGRFVRKYSPLAAAYSWGDPIGNTVQAEIERDGNNWSPLKAGLFGGSPERLRSAKQRVDSFIAGASQR